MDLGVAGRSFVIFGGSAGIGRSAAETLAADGARVTIASRGARADTVAEELSERTGVTVRAARCDLTEPDAADAVVAHVMERDGALHGMAVTTGLGLRGQHGLEDATDADWTATFEDVLLATARACRAAVPAIVESGGGAIVTTAAYSIRAPKAHQVPYGALKSGVATMTKALANAYGPQGVRANCVCPGATETETLAAMRTHYARERGWPVSEALERAMAEDWGMKVALGRPGRPSEVGDVMAFLLSARAGYVNGAIVNVDGGTDF